MIEMVTTQGWPPRWLTEPPAGLSSRGDRAIDFISTHCRVTKDSVGGCAGDLLSLRPWQKLLIEALLTEDPSGRLAYRHALIGMPRKNGKSSLSAGLALFGLLFSGPGAEVYSCAGDKEQAKIVFNGAKAMVEMDPELRQVIRVYRDTLEVPSTGAIYRVLSSEAYTKEGLSPNLVIFDEVHVQPDDDLWSVMEMASGSRVEPQMIGITTAGTRTDSRGHDSLCYRMYRHGRDVASGLADDPTFFFSWWEPAAGMDADHRDPAVWRECNPGFGDIVSELDFHSTLPRVHESDFRMKRTNVFVSARESWLPYGAWDRLADPSAHLVDGDTIVLGFDGSIRSDATAIAAVRMNYGEKPFVTLLAVWERPNGDPDWLVPVAEVLDKFREFRTRYHVKEVAADTSYWQEPLQRLHSEGLKILDFAQSPERLNRATTGFYEAVMTGGLVHDANEVLARHIGNAVLKYDTYGRGRIVKPQKSSEAKVDAAQAAVFAFDYAVNHRGVGAGWLQFMKNERAKQEEAVPVAAGPVAADRQDTSSGLHSQPSAPAVPPRATEYFDAEGMHVRPACSQHRFFNRPGGGYVCTQCGEERES